MSGVQQWLQFFEQISCFHREMLMRPLWDKHPTHAIDVWASLAIFLEGYAFERQGRRPDYFHAAVDALFYCKQQHNSNLTQRVVSCVWQQFSQLLNNQNLNPQNNPLCPKGTNYTKRYKQTNKSYITQKPSVIEVALSNIPRNFTFTTYLQDQINRNNSIQLAFNSLKSIWGIGDKIASFYLRDLVDVMNISLNNTQYRYLLQPIDIWVERTVKILAANQGMNKNQVAKWIVNTSIQYNINPEQVNMGIWFFCSTIVGSEYRLNIALTNLSNAQNLVSDFRSRVRNVCQNC